MSERPSAWSRTSAGGAYGVEMRGSRLSMGSNPAKSQRFHSWNNFAFVEVCQYDFPISQDNPVNIERLIKIERLWGLQEQGYNVDRMRSYRYD